MTPLLWFKGSFLRLGLFEENCADLESSILSSDHGTELATEDVEFLREYATSKGGPGFAGLRNALHIALGLSPVFLFSAQSLSKKHLNRKTLILVSV